MTGDTTPNEGSQGGQNTENAEEAPAAKSNESGNNSFENMESLLLDDDEENALGTESLLMTDSAGEDKTSPRKQRRNQLKGVENEVDKGPDVKDDKASAGTEFESDKVALSVEEGDKDEAYDQTACEVVDEAPVGYRKKKLAVLVDSDSETEGNMTKVPEIYPDYKKRFAALVDSDSEPETTQEQGDSDSTATQKKKKKTVKKKGKAESGNEGDESSQLKTKKKGRKKEVPVEEDSLSSAASISDDEVEALKENSQEQEEEDATGKPAKKVQRASAKKAIDEMQLIQSETQRLYRETQVNIPYHKPKRHTLKEFLTRRTIQKPNIGGLGTGKRLKMSKEELVEYAKQLEERAKEATEFFKSESEDELHDNIEHEGNEAEELPKESENSSEIPEKSSDVDKILDSTEPAVNTIIEQSDPLYLSTQELMELDMPQESESIPPTFPSSLDAVIEKITNIRPESEPTPSTSKSRPKSLEEIKHRLVAEKNLPAAPMLKGDPNMIIDLETGDMVPPKPTGVETLFQRFIKSNPHLLKKPKGSITSPDSEANFLKTGAVIEEPNKNKEPKPGAAYAKLKQSLRSMITKKRKEDFQKKVEENKEEEEEYLKCCGLDDDDEDEEHDEPKKERRERKPEKEIIIDEEENEIELMEDEEVDEPEENAEDLDGEEDLENGRTQEISEVNDEDEDEDEENESESEEENDEEDQSRRKHRVIKAFEDSDEEKDVGNTDLNTTGTNILFAEEKAKDPEEVEEELLDLCSGQFGETQKSAPISQIPITQATEKVDDAQLMDLCSGVFEPTQADESKQRASMKILSSDEEKEKEDEETTTEVKKVKKLRKKKKKRAKLGFSDDEDEEEIEEHDSFDEEEVEEIPETFVEYDSEENEIEVQLTKKDCLKKANEFLEKEAELSESEWGSADEDEQHLDKYEIELGDEDDFDREKIHNELEQIHMRKVLDDDLREVKKIQEMLFDDEEIDGVGRQRKFRWKNIESGFSLDNPVGDNEQNDANADSAEEDDELEWRKMRFEREQMLKDKPRDELIKDLAGTELGKRLLIQKEVKTHIVVQKQVEVKNLEARDIYSKILERRARNQSILKVDRVALKKFVDNIDREDEEINRVSKYGNFVFAPLSEEQKAQRKRKAAEAQLTKQESVSKKPKAEKPLKRLLLDRLL